MNVPGLIVAELRVRPAQQCLGRHDLAGPEVDDRLVDHPELREVGGADLLADPDGRGGGRRGPHR